MVTPPVRRASAVRSPAPSRGLARAQAEWKAELGKRFGSERLSILRGLLWLAVLILLLSGARAGWMRMFVPHWWWQW